MSTELLTVCIWCGTDNSNRPLAGPKWSCRRCGLFQVTAATLRAGIRHYEDAAQRYRQALERLEG